MQNTCLAVGSRGSRKAWHCASQRYMAHGGMLRQVAELKAQDLDRSEKVVAELRELSNKAETKMMEVEAARNAEEVSIYRLTARVRA